MLDLIKAHVIKKENDSAESDKIEDSDQDGDDSNDFEQSPQDHNWEK
jgi:hypothetical protein